MTPIQAIKAYFEKDGGRKVDMHEMKALSSKERHDLGELCAKALGVSFEPSTVTA